MVRLNSLSGSVLALASLSSAALPTDWQSRSIYQVMTDRFAVNDGSTTASCDLLKYCGGTFQGIINKLDYIQGMGFTAVQISPVSKNIDGDTKYGEAYHGYWPNDLYSINQHFGDGNSLKALSKALHDRGMYLMVDVVINDMAIATVDAVTAANASSLDFAGLRPFNDMKYYHPFCNITSWSDPQIAQNCWFGVETVALPDLYTEHDEVVSMIGTWVKQLVSNYSIDGLRIDATKHMDDAYLSKFTANSGIFTMGEVYDEGVDKVCKYEGLVGGLLNYPVYFGMLQGFTNGNMQALATTRSNVGSGCHNLTLLGAFAENHDLPRIASLVQSEALAANIIAYQFGSDGIPQLYQGQEQHAVGNYSPYNREAMWTIGYNTDANLYKLTAALNGLRNHAISIDSKYVTELSTQLYLDQSTIALRKGPDGVQIVSVLSNQGDNMKDYTLVIPNAFKEGQKAVEVTTCETVTATAGGNITVSMSKGAPRVFFPAFNMNGSGLCGYAKSAAKNSSSTGKKSAAEHVQWNMGTVIFAALISVSMWML